MENETIEVIPTPVSTMPFKNVAINAVTGAVIGAVVGEILMFVMSKVARKFRKTKLTIVDITENTEK
jgi:glycopeptide antibiotics resistance protein